ncbi:hypothetical protein [Salipiger aestuarii]|nr:hypothetical protein [Salipiger aestuarii]
MQVDSRRIAILICASNAGTMKQSHWLGLLLSLEGSVDHLILKNGYFVTMHMLNRRLCTMFGHRHHMRKCTRHNELQCNKNDEDPTEHTVSFSPPTINTSGGSVVKSERAFQLLEAHDFVGSNVLRSASAICALLPLLVTNDAFTANGSKVSQSVSSPLADFAVAANGHSDAPHRGVTEDG